MPTNYKNQKYSSIKSDCLKKGELFEDPEFPANSKSLFYSKIDQDIQWKRPSEICKVPKLIVEGATNDDLQEGEIGNTWFVTACASLTKETKLFQNVIPDLKSQEFNEKSEKPSYAGVFQFRFWRYGEWVDVVVDDRLPTKDKELIFCHSKQTNEFWSALLEKAYAKLYGDYETLSNGRTADALVDFTGGVAEKLVLATIGLSDTHSQLGFFEKLKDALDNHALVNCNIQCSKDDIGSETAQGLILGHGYNITNVIQIEVPKKLQGKIGQKILYMLRLANPWNVKEWNGPWSDGADEWNALTAHEWSKIGLKFENEGEFWMCLEDFVNNFTNVDICHFVNTSLFSLKKSWTESIFHGDWHVSGRNGGSDWNSNTFLSNPQYVFDILGIRDKIMVSLEQHDISMSRQELGIKHNEIGFQIMKVEENRKYRVHINGDLIFKSEYKRSRSIFGTVELKKGRYVLFPTTKDPGETGKYMLRLYTSSPASSKELIDDAPVASCCGKPPILVSTITVEGATGLEIPATSKVKSIDPYVKIYCEGEKVVSEKLKQTASPEWNVKATFYRKKPDLEPITVEIWNGNVLIDDFMAEARVDIEGNEEGEKKKCDIFGRKKEKDVIMPGNLHVLMKSSHDLAYL
ncbi:calpain-5-like [Mya arenaria]|uniref:calpain-5-like n=1 Tax=Mya arenaria TaxID=6604 RepID=UPI0022E114CB|nr:calpain-5-like [Mya arenaria]XP_052787581.1 calpain-5-like [Mya arenaria]XP_052787582.1 calpain-5-like [Mya arenaria]XP_052787583.1 calpain-5-like [Mya arenaria]